MDEAPPAFPFVDASVLECISDAHAEFFRQNGLLVLRNVLCTAELAELQRETGALVAGAVVGRPDDPDYRYARHPDTGEAIPYRVEYVVDKAGSARTLLAHPFLLRTAEKLQGPGFVPTWDSMVFKAGGAGAPIAWHRDGGLYPEEVSDLTRGRVFNVDIYLDRADRASCLWGLLGSNGWSEEEANATIAQRNEGGVSTEGAVPLTMEAGDVIVHDVTVLHGSEATCGALRRVIYYEFRPLDVEEPLGPHTADYLEAKQHVLAAAIRHRTGASYARDETPFDYAPRGISASEVGEWSDDPPTWRYPHEDFWRWAVAQ